MISFKDYLTEARMAPLYHGTSVDSASNILKYNMINGMTQQTAPHLSGRKIEKYKTGWHDGERHLISGVSLSRNPRIAFNFGPIVFEFDQAKLMQNYKIRPINHFWTRGPANDPHNPARQVAGKNKDWYNESEEFLIGSLKEMDKYLISILHKIPSNELPVAIRNHPKLRQVK